MGFCGSGAAEVGAGLSVRLEAALGWGTIV